MSDNVFSDVIDNATWIEILTKLRGTSRMESWARFGRIYVETDDGREFRVGLTPDPAYGYDVVSVHPQ